MRRNLHIKLVLIMVLLIVSLMVVVGAFLMNSVTGCAPVDPLCSRRFSAQMPKA